MKKILKNFLELRKHPSCIILSIIGFFDIVSIVMWIIANSGSNTTFIVAMFFLFLWYMANRIYFLPIYMSVIAILFITEKIFNVKLDNNFTENNKLYRNIWITGFLGMIIESIIVIPCLFSSITTMEGYPK